MEVLGLVNLDHAKVKWLADVNAVTNPRFSKMQGVACLRYYYLLKKGYYAAYVWNRRLGTTYRSHLQGPRCSSRWDQWVVPKRLFQSTSRRVITRKTEVFSSTAAGTCDLEKLFSLKVVWWLVGWLSLTSRLMPVTAKEPDRFSVVACP